MSCANVHQQRTCDNVELMEVPITQFRREIFDLANRALEGETITVAYKGKRLRIVPDEPLYGWLSLAITCAGMAFTLWARFFLGRNWSGTVTVKQNHELIRSGPYGIVRHPIYASLLAMLLCTLFLLTPWQWFAVSLALFICGTEIRVYSEEALLESRFGEEFEVYRKAVPAYIPFVR